MIRAAIFDLDGVIRRFDVASLESMEKRHGLPPRAILSALLHPDRMEAATTGLLTDDAWREAAARELGPAGEEFLLWEGISGHVDEAILDLVRRVRLRVPVALLTNATSRLSTDLRRLGLDEAFDAVVNTSEIGFAKPNPRAFELTAEALGYVASEIVFVDDTRRNVDAASELGFVAHHFIGVEALAEFLSLHRLL